MPNHRTSLALVLGSCLTITALTSGWQVPKVFSNLLADPAYAQTATPTLFQAEDSISLTAMPPRVGELGEIKIKPGEKFQATVRVLNSSDKDIEIETFVKDFVIDVDGKTPLQVKEVVDDRWSLASWVVAAPSRQMVKARKTANVNILIEVPADARPGGHYAMVLHQPASVKTEDQPASTGVNQQVGSLLYVVIDGAIQEEAFIRDFAFKPNLAEFGPMHFFYGISNESDIHIRPNATVEIYNIFNQKVDTILVETQNVFPGTQRAFSGLWGVNWGFGPYKAILSVNYGTQGKIVTAQATAWLIPISIIIAVLILVLAIITGLVAVKRHKNTPPTQGGSNSVGNTDSVSNTTSPTEPS
jgi:hypothetical protein